MSNSTRGRRKECSIADARKRLHDADAFLEVALQTIDPDVKATNAIHAAMAAADAICCAALGERSTDGNHSAAVPLLGSVDRQLGNALRRALDRKPQAGHESRDVSAQDAESCLHQAAVLTEAARTRVLAV
ncbi:MAG: hypothetical protein ACYDEA_07685 [Candidatus Dormibacteria bacterium]